MPILFMYSGDNSRSDRVTMRELLHKIRATVYKPVLVFDYLFRKQSVI